MSAVSAGSRRRLKLRCRGSARPSRTRAAASRSLAEKSSSRPARRFEASSHLSFSPLSLSQTHTHTHTTHSLPSASLELSIKRGSNGRRRTLTQPFPSLSHRLEYIIIDVGPVAPTTSHVSSIRARFSDRPSLFRSASKRWQGAGTRLSVLLVFISF